MTRKQGGDFLEGSQGCRGWGVSCHRPEVATSLTGATRERLFSIINQMREFVTSLPLDKAFEALDQIQLEVDFLETEADDAQRYKEGSSRSKGIRSDLEESRS